MICKKCDLYKTCKTPFIQGVGPKKAKLFFVGEAPGAEEDTQGIPFVGESGQIFNELLKDSKIDRNDIFIDNVVKCRPPNNRNPKPTEVKSCIPYLIKKIEEIKPNIIIPMGAIALKALTNLSGITYFEGKVLFHPKFNCYIIPILHPAALYRDLMENIYTRYVETNKIFKKIKSFRNKKMRRVSHIKILINKKEICKKLFDIIKEKPFFGFDSETEGFNYLEDNILGISLSYFDKKFYDFYIPNEFIDYEYLSKMMKERNNLLIGHNLKFDAHFLKKKNVNILEKGFFDTMLAHYSLNENNKGYYNLKTESWLHTDFGGYEEELKEKLNRKKSFKEVPFPILSKYACLDAEATLRLYFYYKKKLVNANSWRLLSLLFNATKLLLYVEDTGINVDLDYLLKVEKKGLSYLNKIEKELKEIAGDENFNVRSHKQKKQVFLKLGIKSSVMTDKGNPSFNEEALNKLKGTHSFVDKLIQYNESYTLYNTHVSKIKDRIRKDSKIHPTFLIHGTTTGRLSSNGPNFQQVPKLKRIRNIYIPSKGNKIIEADYSQMELRLLAHFSEDPVLIETYKKDGDIHNVVMKEMSVNRKVAKGINFGLIYGRGPMSLATDLNISFEEAKEYMTMYFKRFPRVEIYLQQEVERAKKEPLISLFGRHRNLVPFFQNTNSKLVSHASNQAKNFRIQSSASDITLSSAISFYRRFKDRFKIIGLIHDSILLDIPGEEVDFVNKELKYTMENIVKLKVPLKVAIDVMDHWGDNLEK